MQYSRKRRQPKAVEGSHAHRHTCVVIHAKKRASAASNFILSASMVTVSLIVAGKMGISHLSILGTHPDFNVVGGSDTSPMVLDVLGKHSPFRCYKDYEAMIEKEKPEAV